MKLTHHTIYNQKLAVTYLHKSVDGKTISRTLIDIRRLTHDEVKQIKPARTKMNKRIYFGHLSEEEL